MHSLVSTAPVVTLLWLKKTNSTILWYGLTDLVFLFVEFDQFCVYSNFKSSFYHAIFGKFLYAVESLLVKLCLIICQCGFTGNS